VPGKRGIQVGGIEAELLRIRDPERRAVRAVEAHREARELTGRLSDLRRDALKALHDAGRTWQEVADVVGLSLKATTKAVHGAGDADHWWKRVPDEVVEPFKLGPGGRERTRVLSRTQLMDAVVEVMADLEHDSRKLGRGAARVGPAQLAALSTEHLGRQVAMPSLRQALVALIDEGRVARVGHGRYVLAKPAARQRPGQLRSSRSPARAAGGQDRDKRKARRP